MLDYQHPEAVRKFLERNSLLNFAPTYGFLRKIGDAFKKIPYENLTKLIRARTHDGSDLRLRLPEILYEDHLRFGTGGTCFSMTYFLQTILRSCGFETYPVMADRPLVPNTHCLSIVILNGQKFLVDPGFMIYHPVALTPVASRTNLGHATIMICDSGAEDEYIIATISNNKTNVRYFMRDKALTPDEFLGYWQDSFDWPTLRNISISVALNDGYVYARNNFLRVTRSGGKTQERLKKDVELTLGKTFNIDEGVIRDAMEMLSLRASAKQSS